MKEFHTIVMSDGKKKIAVMGSKVDNQAFVYKDEFKTWYVVDLKSGYSITHNKTKKGAIEEYKSATMQEKYKNVLATPRYAELVRQFESL